MSSSRFKRFASLLFLTLSSCAHTREPAPTYCTPTESGVVCPADLIPYPKAFEFLCFKPVEIEPIMEKCTK